MTQIANAARKLLRHLGVWKPTQAPDGPAIAVLQVLASTHDGSEDAVVRATARVGRLVEILEAADAAREFERRARMGAEDVVRIGKLVVLKGHRGEAAVNDWIAAMMSIYKQITGKDPGISVGAPGRRRRGKAAGPLIRFLEAAGKPIGIQLAPESLAGRIKDIRTGGRRRQKWIRSRHFVVVRPDSHVRADMAPVRSNTRKNASPISDGLAELVRLLARQAARETSEQQLETDRSMPPRSVSEKRS